MAGPPMSPSICTQTSRPFVRTWNPDPFIARDPEDIQPTVIGDRALVVLTVRTRKQDGGESRFRNIRLFSRSDENWVMEFWYNYEVTSL